MFTRKQSGRQVTGVFLDSSGQSTYRTLLDDGPLQWNKGLQDWESQIFLLHYLIDHRYQVFPNEIFAVEPSGEISVIYRR